MFAAAKAKAVYVPISPRLAPSEIAFIVDHARPKILLVEPEFLAIVAKVTPTVRNMPTPLLTSESAVESFSTFEAWVDTASAPLPDGTYNPQEPVVMLYTSGTTGQPKGVRLSSRSLLAVATELRNARDPWYGWSSNTVSMVSQPTFHIGGVWWLTQGLAQGCTNVILRGFDPRTVLQIIPRYRIGTTCLAPAMIQLLLLEPDCRQTDFSSLQTIGYGGSTCPTALLKEAMAVFKCGFCNAYGMTETGNVVVSLRPEEHRGASDARLKAVGKPMPGVQVRIVDEGGAEVPPRTTGQIIVRSPSNMVDYWKQEDATRATLVDSWLMTGDAGYRDEDGFIYVSDRIRDMIICAGENVFPAELEGVIREHPLVADVAVIGVPDTLWGEAVHAIVVTKEGHTLRSSDVVRHVRGKVAEFKVPRTVEFVNALPRNPAGKILKRQLREPYWRGLDRMI
jgi:long-chain acyl-CoA synthetase